MISIQHTDDKPTLLYYKEDVFTNDELEFLKTLTYIDGVHNNKLVSRKQRWFQEQNKYFCPIWNQRLKRWESNPYFTELYNIQQKVQDFVNLLYLEHDLHLQIDIPTFNSCLINKYETGDDFIPPHKDTPLSFGEYPMIVCISFGETRTMVLKNDTDTFEFPLKSNSIFIMAGSSQKYFTHEISKSDTQQPRYSMTFRQFIL
jgi:alkylated DNA repair dioxygenase AlkB